jgi:hypothetical protein
MENDISEIVPPCIATKSNEPASSWWNSWWGGEGVLFIVNNPEVGNVTLNITSLYVIAFA